MRIAMLTNNVLPGREGIGRHVTEVGRRLRDRGHEVTVLAPNNSIIGWQTAEIEGLRVELYPHLACRPLHHAVDRIGLQHWFDQQGRRQDVVHLHLPLFPPLRCGPPTIVTFHTPMLADTRAITEPGLQPKLVRLNARLFSRGFEQWYLDNAATVIAVSTRVAGELEAGYRTRGRTLQVIENGVDLDHFAWKPYAGRGSDIVCVGRLGYRKGLARLLGAFTSIAGSCKANLVFVGEGVLEGDLRRQAEACGIAHRVKFAGFLDRDEVCRCLQRAALFVSPSEYEGFPLTLLEALAAGAPVVSTRTGLLADRPDALPVLAVESTAAALAAAMLALLSHPAEAARLAEDARRVVEDRYDWNTAVDALEAVYRHAVRLAA